MYVPKQKEGKTEGTKNKTYVRLIDKIISPKGEAVKGEREKNLRQLARRPFVEKGTARGLLHNVHKLFSFFSLIFCKSA